MVEPIDRVSGDRLDEIVEDIRAVRRAHAAAFGFHVACLVADLRKKDAASDDRLVSLPPKPARHRELEKFVNGKIESGVYSNASEVVHESPRMLKEHDEMRVKWREQIEQGWLQAQRGDLVDGDVAFDRLEQRIKEHGGKSTS